MDYGVTVLKKTAHPITYTTTLLTHSQPLVPHFPFLADAPTSILLALIASPQLTATGARAKPTLPRRRSPPLPQGPSMDLVSTALASSSRLHRGNCRRPGRPDPASWPSREPPRAAQGRSLADPWPPRLPYLSEPLSWCRAVTTASSLGCPSGFATGKCHHPNHNHVDCSNN
jgi:hypothetical protein